MKNAIIVASKRSGSTFLQEALNSHPNIICHDEMFMNYRKNRKRRGQFLYGYMKTQGYNIDQYIDWLFSSNKDSSVCFRLMYPHIKKNSGVISIINKNNIPVIHLIRQNHFHRYVSSQTKKQNKVNINTDNMRSTINRYKSEIESRRKNFNKLKNYIEIYYEDMFGDVEGEKQDEKNYGAFNIKSTQITYLKEKYTKKICDFFDVDEQDLYSNVTKRNSWNIWDHVKNVKQVEKFLIKNKMKDLM